MKEQVLSREQMQELIDMGIDTSNASMYWTPKNYLDVIRNEYDRDAIPDLGFIYAFTLQDILEMLPDSILGSTKQIKTVEFKLSTRGNKVYYMQDNFNQQWLKCTNGNTLLEAAFNMLKWCKENQYI